MTLPVMALFTFVHVPIFLAVLMEKFFAVNSTDCGVRTLKTCLTRVLC